MNATEAYLRVYEKATRESATRLSSQLLKNVDVSAEITRRLKESQMSADEVLQRISEQAKGEYAKYIQADGWVDIAGMVRDGKAHLIKSVQKVVKTYKDGQDEYTTITFHDGQKALALMGKYHALFTEKVDVTTKGESLNIEAMKPSEIAKQVALLLSVSGKDDE